ncbi:MAG: hypothetical protein U0Q55_03200 [Vicinamibacterales bacterium]
MNELYERARRAEDDYFRRKDAELIERAREARAQGTATAASPQRSEGEQALVDALGIEDPAVVGPLHAAGLSASNVSLLDWLPAIEVAWVDDVDMHEREELRRQYATDPASDGASLSLLTEWLFVRPPHEALLAARQALRRRVDALPEPERRSRIQAIVQRCETVGHASGGIFGLGTLSWDEQARIEAIREALGDEPDPLNGPVEIPH